MNRPKVVALDVVETLFSLKSLVPRFERVGLQAGLLPTFFAQMLRDAFALEASGDYRPFRDVAQAALAVMLESQGRKADAAAVDSVLAGFAELEAHADIAPGLERLHALGLRVITLTNGAADNTRKLLARANLERFVERVVSIDEVRRWKPSPEVYLHASRQVGVDAGQMMLVAAHAWDIQGAKRAGLSAAWISRQDKSFSRAMTRPDIRAASLVEVAQALGRMP